MHAWFNNTKDYGRQEKCYILAAKCLGYDSVKDLQYKVIEEILDRREIFIVLPTVSFILPNANNSWHVCQSILQYTVQSRVQALDLYQSRMVRPIYAPVAYHYYYY